MTPVGPDTIGNYELAGNAAICRAAPYDDSERALGLSPLFVDDIRPAILIMLQWNGGGIKANGVK